MGIHSTILVLETLLFQDFCLYFYSYFNIHFHICNKCRVFLIVVQNRSMILKSRVSYVKESESIGMN